MLYTLLIWFADPVFFLHHTKLDRLWWRWQRENQQQRLTEYLGNAAHNSTRSVLLEDTIPMGNLARDVQVSQVMNTESELLCYRYWSKNEVCFSIMMNMTILSIVTKLAWAPFRDVESPSSLFVTRKDSTISNLDPRFDTSCSRRRRSAKTIPVVTLPAWLFGCFSLT